MSTLGRRVAIVRWPESSNLSLSVLLRSNTSSLTVGQDFVLELRRTGSLDRAICVTGMYYVYILHSLKESDRYYVGYTVDLDKRLNEHNSGKSAHTKPWAPWEVLAYTAFKSKDKAQQFEKYLKSGSGYAFLRKRLV